MEVVLQGFDGPEVCGPEGAILFDLVMQAKPRLRQAQVIADADQIAGREVKGLPRWP